MKKIIVLISFLLTIQFTNAQEERVALPSIEINDNGETHIIFVEELTVNEQFFAISVKKKMVHQDPIDEILQDSRMIGIFSEKIAKLEFTGKYLFVWMELPFRRGDLTKCAIFTYNEEKLDFLDRFTREKI